MTRNSKYVEEIKFAAKAGFISRAIWEEFFAQGKIAWRNRQWRMMREKGLFKHYQSKIAPKFYILNPKSQIVQRIIGEKIGRPVPLANLSHDEILLYGLMKLLRKNEILQFTLERELKKDTVGGVGAKDKFPDALIRSKSDRQFAIEVELGRKSIHRYRDILVRYCFQENLAGVIYVCDPDIFQAVENAKCALGSSNPKLVRISIEDWQSGRVRFNL